MEIKTDTTDKKWKSGQYEWERKKKFSENSIKCKPKSTVLEQKITENKPRNTDSRHQLDRT